MISAQVVRRVFFTALLAAIAPGSKLQVALALFVSVLYLVMYIEYRPFVLAEDDMVANIAAWLLRRGILRREECPRRASREDKGADARQSATLGAFPGPS